MFRALSEPEQSNVEDRLTATEHEANGPTAPGGDPGLGPTLLSDGGAKAENRSHGGGDGSTGEGAGVLGARAKPVTVGRANVTHD